MSERPALRLIAGGGQAVDDRALADLGRDDIGNAERLIARHGADLKRTPGIGPLVFDGARWRVDDDGAHARLKAQATARSIRTEADAIETEGPGDKERAARAEDHRKFAAQSANAARLSAMLGEAWPHLTAERALWNSRPTLFNVENGTLELDAGEVKLRSHRRDDYLTHMAGVAYDENAECPTFRAFLNRVLPPLEAIDPSVLPDRSLQHFVRRALGACLIDSARDQAMIVFHGAGANGKSTLLNAVARVLGSYCMSVDVRSILYNEQSGSNATPDVARLAERPRLIRVSEPDPGAKLSEGGVKALTGGEPIVARKLHEAPIEFALAGKIVLSCNNRPVIRGGDDGIWRRILLVPWRVQIPDEEQRERGQALEAALAAEGPGILNWLLEGLADYQLGGLCPPAAVLDETQAYRDDSDVLGRFITECCHKGDGRKVLAAALYDAYAMWARDEGLEPRTRAVFGKQLTNRGFAADKRGDHRWRLGLALTDKWKEALRP